ncbi:hypothetical protein BGZ93_000393 [Podila epicladia]|nr:hypothetical protein BGZ92_003266 [Podila epicladia]KAG0085904.1 hypothetical protein BGZ93_000393 [Podila epicladia]
MKILVGLAALASVAFADITFNVIGYPSSNAGAFGVSVGGKITKLSSNESSFPVWSGTVPGTDNNVEYSYVELSAAGTPVKTETFTRKLNDTKAMNTMNEFFERPVTVWDLPKIPYTYLATYPSKTKAFKQKQIATIHVTAPAAQISELLANPENGKSYYVDFRFVNSKTIHSVRNITLKTSGKSSKAHSKQAFKFKFDTDYNQTFFHRPNIKLRSMVMDPTMMREKLYIDMLNSAGIPTQQGAWVRLFINNEPYGLYLMVDDIKKSFLKQTVHGGDAAIQRGSLVQGNAFVKKADLMYEGPMSKDYDPDCYVSQNLGTNPTDDPLKELISLMSDLKSFDPATPNAVQFWNETRLDLDGVLRNMALEYLGAAFDNYWMSASNYFIYKNPTMGPTGKWQWLPTDFDGTFGNGSPKSTVDTYKNWYDFKDGDRPLVSKLILQNKEINALFEQVLKELVSTAFKPEALVPRIQTYNKMLSLDAQWDISLTRKSPGINNGFTFDDFNNNLNVRTKDMSFGLIPFVQQISDYVAQELGFIIPAGLADRVAPPARGGNEDDDENDSSESDKDNSSKNNAGSRAVTSGGSVVLAMIASVLLA